MADLEHTIDIDLNHAIGIDRDNTNGIDHFHTPAGHARTDKRECMDVEIARALARVAASS